MLFKRLSHSQEKLIHRLAMMRPMTSLMERDILPVTGDIVEVRENWVRMWVDTGHVVSFDGGRITAFRGICDRGQPMWLVRHKNKKHGYHSLHSDPIDAVEEAQAAWDARRGGRARWNEVERCAADLLRGRRRLTVTMDDAHASALCAPGIEAFLRRIGLGRVRRVSGRIAALMMKLEPQVGFVILAAMDRAAAEATEASDAVRDSPATAS